MKKIVNYIKENWTILLAYSIGACHLVVAILLIIAMITGKDIDSSTLNTIRNSAVFTASTL